MRETIKTMLLGALGVLASPLIIIALPFLVLWLIGHAVKDVLADVSALRTKQTDMKEPSDA
jgi:hypothetical protein